MSNGKNCSPAVCTALGCAVGAALGCAAWFVFRPRRSAAKKLIRKSTSQLEHILLSVLEFFAA